MIRDDRADTIDDAELLRRSRRDPAAFRVLYGVTSCACTASSAAGRATRRRPSS
jgi:hypothetical protein